MAMIAADIAPQGPINPAADAYALTCLRLSAQIPRIRDISYGAAPAQRLDLYLPEQAGPCPVFLFWHGGGYTHGHKEWCGFMAPPLTDAGAIFVSANYRLFPEGDHSQTLDDARAALLWVIRNIADHGGDPGRIVIGGHSAGANIAARLVLDAASLSAAGIAPDTVKAVLAMSGSYTARRGETHPDPARRPASGEPDAPADFPGPTPAPFTIAWGTEERPPFPEAGAEFTEILKSRGMTADAMPFEGDDHFSVHLATAKADNRFVQVVLDRLGLARSQITDPPSSLDGDQT